MDKLKQVVVPSVIAAVVVGVVLIFFMPVKETGKEIPAKQLGATPGNEINGKYFSIGGVDYASVYMPTIATSSVPCVTKNPFTASSTLLAFTANFSDTVVDLTPGMDLSTSTNAYLNATSSSPIVANFQQASNTQDDFLWVNSTLTGTPHYTLRPKDYVGLKLGTSTPGNDTFTGHCTATFQKL